MSLYLGDQIISGQATLVGESRNIGQIIPSAIPLTDAGLHLLDGALIQGSGIYSAFVDYIAGLVSTYPNLFVTESAWQSSVTTYGVCGKFVYDSTNNTVRIPKVTGKIDGTTDINALGDIVEAGLPIDWLAHTHTRGDMNITGSGWDLYGGSNNDWHGAFVATVTNRYSISSGSAVGGGNLSLDASRSWTGSTSQPSYTNSARKNASTIHEQAVNMFFYIVLATSTKTDIEVDIDQYITDFNAVQHSADDAVTTANTASNQVDSWRSSLAEVKCVVETYSNGTSWYRVYSDGWCEQGGSFTSNGAGFTSITFLKPFLNANYTLSGSAVDGDNNAALQVMGVYDKQASGVQLCNAHNGNFYVNNVSWQACGYIN